MGIKKDGNDSLTKLLNGLGASISDSFARIIAASEGGHEDAISRALDEMDWKLQQMEMTMRVIRRVLAPRD